MALREDAFKSGNIVTGLAIGVGAAVLSPLLAPVGRTLVRSAVKGGVILYGWGREVAAQTGEMTSDLVAEARAETSPAGPATAAPSPTKRPSAEDTVDGRRGADMAIA